MIALDWIVMLPVAIAIGCWLWIGLSHGREREP